MDNLNYKRTAHLSKQSEIQMSWLQRAYFQLPPSSEAPEALSILIYPQRLGTQAGEVKEDSKWAKSISPKDIGAHSDGSSEGHDRCTWGYVLRRGRRTFQTKNGFLFGEGINNAELAGAAMALQAAVLQKICGEKNFILLDNQAVVTALQTEISSSCSKLTLDSYYLTRKLHAEVRWWPVL